MGGRYPKGTKHLDFRQICDTGLTTVHEVVNVHQGVRVGIIKWNGSWRKYCLFPSPGTMFDTGCMDQISAFIEALMAGRRKKKVVP